MLHRATLILLPATAAAAVLLAAGAPAPIEEPPTFNRDVAPVIFSHCAPCHRPGGPGPFDLLSYADVYKRARQIAEVTGDRYMPPWLPEEGYGEFQGERRLTQAEIDLIRRWVESGAERGDPADLPPAPEHHSGWTLGEPDVVAEMPQAYQVPAEGRDVFRNFVIPIPVPTTRYVRAVDLVPDNPKLIHHATMWIDRTRLSRRVDEESPEPGYPSMDPRMSAEDPDGHFLGWTPGTLPYAGRDDLAWRLEPGTDLVLQIHMLPTGRPEPLRCKVGFYFADAPPQHVPFVLWLGSRTLDIPAGVSDYTMEDSYRLPVDVEVLALRPHAHYLARRIEAWATLPDGSRQWLLEMRWDFNWQEEYRYREPIALPAGTELGIRYVYDNSAANPMNPHEPPRQVLYGPYSEDEMGDLWVQVLPRTAADREALVADFYGKERQAFIEGYRLALREHPGDAATRIDLAVALDASGRTEEAIAAYREALEVRPDYGQAYNNLGALLARQGDLKTAEEYYRRALDLDPSLFEAHYNLGALELQRGHFQEAESQYRAGLALNPDNARARNNLGTILEQRRQPGPALEQYLEAIHLTPDHAGALFNAGRVLAGQGRMNEGRDYLERALAVEPDLAPAHFSLGVLLATQGDLEAARRHLERAVEIAPDLEPARRLLERLSGGQAPH